MSREELIEALAKAIWDTAEARFPTPIRLPLDRAPPHAVAARRAEALAALSVLNPLLERVAGGLEPFAKEAEAYAEAWEDWPDKEALAGGNTVGHFRQAASLHTELKGLLP